MFFHFNWLHLICRKWNFLRYLSSHFSNFIVFIFIIDFLLWIIKYVFFFFFQALHYMYAYSAKIPAIRDKIREIKDDFPLIESSFKGALAKAWTDFINFVGKNYIWFSFSCLYIFCNSVEWPQVHNRDIFEVVSSHQGFFMEVCSMLLKHDFHFLLRYLSLHFHHNGVHLPELYFSHSDLACRKNNKVRWIREHIWIWYMQLVQEDDFHWSVRTA